MSLLLVLAAPASAPPASPPVTLLTASLNFLVDVVIRSLTDLSTDPVGEAEFGWLGVELRLGRKRLPCELNLLADFVIRSLTDLSTDPPEEVALGRLNDALRLGRTRLLWVAPAARTLVLLSVELQRGLNLDTRAGWLTI